MKTQHRVQYTTKCMLLCMLEENMMRHDGVEIQMLSYKMCLWNITLSVKIVHTHIVRNVCESPCDTHKRCEAITGFM